MSWIGLQRPRSGKVIRTSWGRTVVDALDILYYESAVDYMGYIHRDLIPDVDLQYVLGKPDVRVREVYSGYGYFTYDVWIQGKKALKDGDPISIYDIFDTAREKITQAIDYSSYVPFLRSIDETLSLILGQLDVKISQLKKQIEGYLQMIYERLRETLDVDILATEQSYAELLLSVPTSGYKDILFPKAGKRISTRSWHIQSTSTAGRVVLKFRDSGKIIGALLCVLQHPVVHNMVNVTGYPDEPIRLEWTDLSANSDIFYQITYKEVD